MLSTATALLFFGFWILLVALLRLSAVRRSPDGDGYPVWSIALGAMLGLGMVSLAVLLLRLTK